MSDHNAFGFGRDEQLDDGIETVAKAKQGRKTGPLIAELWRDCELPLLQGDIRYHRLTLPMP